MAVVIPCYMQCMMLRCLGIPDDRDGLFDTILLSKNQYQKRAYQCIKMMVSLFTLYAYLSVVHSFFAGMLHNLHNANFATTFGLFKSRIKMAVSP